MAQTKKKKPKLWSGERFANLAEALSHKPGVKNPAGLAASLGRKAHGKANFQEHAAEARKHK
jgi:tRNA U34 5-methylaminomethyl-2-thiouridine-forming methyltransferase MnmC